MDFMFAAGAVSWAVYAAEGKRHMSDAKVIPFPKRGFTRAEGEAALAEFYRRLPSASVEEVDVIYGDRKMQAPSDTEPTDAT